MSLRALTYEPGCLRGYYTRHGVLRLTFRYYDNGVAVDVPLHDGGDSDESSPMPEDYGVGPLLFASVPRNRQVAADAGVSDAVQCDDADDASHVEEPLADQQMVTPLPDSGRAFHDDGLRSRVKYVPFDPRGEQASWWNDYRLDQVARVARVDYSANDNFNRADKVFLGQLKFGMPDWEVVAVGRYFGCEFDNSNMHEVTNKQRQPGLPEVPKGCFKLAARRGDLATLLTRVHKRVLIDHHGFWVAETPDEIWVLDRYVEEVLAHRVDCRLPRKPVTVEAAKRLDDRKGEKKREKAMRRTSRQAATAAKADDASSDDEVPSSLS